MNSPLRLVRHDAPATPDATGDTRVQDYLDHLCAPLIGLLPYETRQAMRMEAEDHLYCLIEAKTEDGMPLEEAIGAALAAYGPPRQLGHTLADEWLCGAESSIPPVRYMRCATLRAFGGFSVSAGFGLLGIEAHLFGLLPSASLPWLYGWLLLSPLLAGVISGWFIPTRSGQAVVNAINILLFYSLAVSLVMLPRIEGFYFTLFELAYALPVGGLAAMLTEMGRRSLHRAWFPHKTQT